MSIQEISYLVMALFFAVTAFMMITSFTLFLKMYLRDRGPETLRRVDPKITAKSQKIAKLFSRHEQAAKKPVDSPDKEKAGIRFHHGVE